MIENNGIYPNEKEAESEVLLRAGFYKTVFVDVDSCVSGIEGINKMAQIHGKEQEVSRLTDRAMNGEIPLDAIFEKRLELICPNREDLNTVAAEYIKTITPHARTVIDILVQNGVDVWLISGGFKDAILPLAHYLGIGERNVLANTLFFFEDGSYRGFDKENPLWQKNGKRKVIENLKGKGRLGTGKIAIIGDGMSEIETGPITDLRIGFFGHQLRPNVKELADVFIASKTFLPLLPLTLDEEHMEVVMDNSTGKNSLIRAFEELDNTVFNHRAKHLKQDLRNIAFKVVAKR